MKFGNPTFLTGAIGLTILGLGGCLAIYSARSFGEDPFYFALRQLVWLGSGVIVFLALARIPFRFYVRYAAALAVLAFTSLILVLIFGTTINHQIVLSFEFAVGFFALLDCRTRSADSSSI